MTSNLKCIIFDLDGVLTETSAQHFQAWCELADKHGITLDPEFEEKLKGVSRSESIKRILAHADKQFTPQQIQAMQDEKNRRYLALIEHFDYHNLYENTELLLEFVRSKGILLALGSASKNAPTLIDALGIKDYFDYIVNPENLKGKPHPDIFLDAAHHFELNPGECIGVEDALAGVQAIKAAGMFAVGIGDNKLLPDADIHFAHIKDLFTYFKKVL